MNTFIQSLKDTISGSEEFLADLGDTAIDSVIESDTLSKIPFLSWVYQVFKIKHNYHLKKIQKNTKSFLEALRGGNSDKIFSLLSKISSDEKYKEEFADTLLNIILESEKPFKAKVLGNLLIAFSEENITQEDFDNLCLLLISASIPSLKALISFKHKDKSKLSAEQTMINESLLFSLGVGFRYGSKFQISNLGEKLYNLGIIESIPVHSKIETK